jgi:hypothetical protein
MINDYHLASGGTKNKGEAVILKMTQKFGLDADIIAEEQVRRTEFNLSKGMSTSTNTTTVAASPLARTLTSVMSLLVAMLRLVAT